MQQDINYKVLTAVSEIKETLTLQKKVWGDSVAASLPEMVAAIHNGGVVIGAFMDNNMIGFCYGFAGYKGTEAYLCSHMLGVDPNYRDLGLGRELKLQQKDWAINYGYKKMVWTYDPLEARNAYLNLCKLGAYTKTYIQCYYGEMEDQLNHGLPSDRFLVEWELLSERVTNAIAGSSLESNKWQSYPILSEWSLQGEYPRPGALNDIQDVSGFLVPVPGSIQDIKVKNPELAREWRFAVRSQMILMFANGYSAVGLLRNDASICYYVLERN
ncbi:MAG: GNAT family N-acetyltransferase [Desulfitobacteriaceae bacterium]|nr:GNAT family N-acetyltransferase [Desulfitobacteriaceae bacterium]MDI6913111.1 GNAT family N-acetyltransferase [Desulfitobacteriaceae bacterium]